jgi:hypothetical protein
VLSSSACPPVLASARRSQFNIPLNQLLHRPCLPSLTVKKQWCQHPSASGDTPCGNDKIHNSWRTAESKAHKNPNSDLGGTADYSLSSLHTWNKNDHDFHLPFASAPPPPEPYHSPGKGPVESRLAHRLDPSRWSDCGCSGNLGPCFSHVHLQMNRRSATCARRRGRTCGRRRWSSDRVRRKGQGSGHRGGCIFIRQGAILTMEHLLATMVSVPPSSGRMPAKGIMEHLLEMMVSLPASPLSVGQAMVIFFYIGFWRWRVGPTLFFLNWNLLPSNIIPYKQHQKIRNNYEQFIVGNLVFE